MNCKSGFSLLMLSLVLPSCSFYEPASLISSAVFLSKPSDVTINTAILPSSDLKEHLFNPADGMDIIEIAILAVVNNPDLMLARTDANIARAQAFSAGLLPDPQLGIGQDFAASSDPTLTSAYSFGLSYDITAVLKYPAMQDAADAEKQKIDLTVLWQEWQTIIQAKQLFSRTVAQERMLAVLQPYHDFLESRRQKLLKVIADHSLSSDVASSALVVNNDIATKLYDLQMQTAKNRRDLNALLGLAPDTFLRLQESDDTESAAPNFEKALEAIPSKRPDLLALRKGFYAEDARYMGAILSQFPSINAGLSKARDTGNIHTTGFSLSINLPLFNRGQGEVAIEKATRERLQQEYQIRLNKAVEEVTALNAEYVLLNAQHEEAVHSLDEMRKALDGAQAALDQHDIDLFTYINLRSAYITKLMDMETIKQNMREHRIAMEMLSMQTWAPALRDGDDL